MIYYTVNMGTNSAEYMREYYQKNKDSMFKSMKKTQTKKWHCDVCNKTIQNTAKYYHLNKSAKHQRSLAGY